MSSTPRGGDTVRKAATGEKASQSQRRILFTPHSLAQVVSGPGRDDAATPAMQRRPTSLAPSFRSHQILRDASQTPLERRGTTPQRTLLERTPARAGVTHSKAEREVKSTLSSDTHESYPAEAPSTSQKPLPSSWSYLVKEGPQLVTPPLIPPTPFHAPRGLVKTCPELFLDPQQNAPILESFLRSLDVDIPSGVASRTDAFVDKEAAATMVDFLFTIFNATVLPSELFEKAVTKAVSLGETKCELLRELSSIAVRMLPKNVQSTATEVVDPKSLDGKSIATFPCVFGAYGPSTDLVPSTVFTAAFAGPGHPLSIRVGGGFVTLLEIVNRLLEGELRCSVDRVVSKAISAALSGPEISPTLVQQSLTSELAPVIVLLYRNHILLASSFLSQEAKAVGLCDRIKELESELQASKTASEQAIAELSQEFTRKMEEFVQRSEADSMNTKALLLPESDEALDVDFDRLQHLDAQPSSSTNYDGVVQHARSKIEAAVVNLQSLYRRRLKALQRKVQLLTSDLETERNKRMDEVAAMASSAELKLNLAAHSREQLLAEIEELRMRRSEADARASEATASKERAHLALVAAERRCSDLERELSLQRRATEAARKDAEAIAAELSVVQNKRIEAANARGEELSKAFEDLRADRIRASEEQERVWRSRLELAAEEAKADEAQWKARLELERQARDAERETLRADAEQKVAQQRARDEAEMAELRADFKRRLDQKDAEIAKIREAYEVKLQHSAFALEEAKREVLAASARALEREKALLASEERNAKSLAEALVVHRNELAASEARNNALAEKLVAAEQKIWELRNELAAMVQARDRLQNQLDETNSRCDDSALQIKQYQQDLQLLSSQYEEQKQLLGDQIASNEALRKQHTEQLQQMVSKSKEALAAAFQRGEARGTEKTRTELTLQLNALQSKYDALQVQLSETQALLASASAKLEQREAELEGANAEKDALTHELAVLRAETHAEATEIRKTAAESAQAVEQLRAELAAAAEQSRIQLADAAERERQLQLALSEAKSAASAERAQSEARINALQSAVATLKNRVAELTAGAQRAAGARAAEALNSAAEADKAAQRAAESLLAGESERALVEKGRFEQLVAEREAEREARSALAVRVLELEEQVKKLQGEIEARNELQLRTSVSDDSDMQAILQASELQAALARRGESVAQLQSLVAQLVAVNNSERAARLDAESKVIALTNELTRIENLFGGTPDSMRLAAVASRKELTTNNPEQSSERASPDLQSESPLACLLDRLKKSTKHSTAKLTTSMSPSCRVVTLFSEWWESQKIFKSKADMAPRAEAALAFVNKRLLGASSDPMSTSIIEEISQAASLASEMSMASAALPQCNSLNDLAKFIELQQQSLNQVGAVLECALALTALAGDVAKQCTEESEASRQERAEALNQLEQARREAEMEILASQREKDELLVAWTLSDAVKDVQLKAELDREGLLLQGLRHAFKEIKELRRLHTELVNIDVANIIDLGDRVAMASEEVGAGALLLEDQLHALGVSLEEEGRVRKELLAVARGAGCAPQTYILVTKPIAEVAGTEDADTTSQGPGLRLVNEDTAGASTKLIVESVTTTHRSAVSANASTHDTVSPSPKLSRGSKFITPSKSARGMLPQPRYVGSPLTSAMAASAGSHHAAPRVALEFDGVLWNSPTGVSIGDLTTPTVVPTPTSTEGTHDTMAEQTMYDRIIAESVTSLLEASDSLVFIAPTADSSTPLSRISYLFGHAHEGEDKAQGFVTMYIRKLLAACATESRGTRKCTVEIGVTLLLNERPVDLLVVDSETPLRRLVAHATRSAHFETAQDEEDEIKVSLDGFKMQDVGSESAHATDPLDAAINLLTPLVSKEDAQPPKAVAPKTRKPNRQHKVTHSTLTPLSAKASSGNESTSTEVFGLPLRWVPIGDNEVLDQVLETASTNLLVLFEALSAFDEVAHRYQQAEFEYQCKQYEELRKRVLEQLSSEQAEGLDVVDSARMDLQDSLNAVATQRGDEAPKIQLPNPPKGPYRTFRISHIAGSAASITVSVRVTSQQLNSGATSKSLAHLVNLPSTDADLLPHVSLLSDVPYRQSTLLTLENRTLYETILRSARAHLRAKYQQPTVVDYTTSPVLAKLAQLVTHWCSSATQASPNLDAAEDSAGRSASTHDAARTLNSSSYAVAAAKNHHHKQAGRTSGMVEGTVVANMIKAAQQTLRAVVLYLSPYAQSTHDARKLLTSQSTLWSSIVLSDIAEKDFDTVDQLKDFIASDVEAVENWLMPRGQPLPGSAVHAPSPAEPLAREVLRSLLHGPTMPKLINALEPMLRTVLDEAASVELSPEVDAHPHLRAIHSYWITVVSPSTHPHSLLKQQGQTQSTLYHSLSLRRALSLARRIYLGAQQFASGGAGFVSAAMPGEQSDEQDHSAPAARSNTPAKKTLATPLAQLVPGTQALGTQLSATQIAQVVERTTAQITGVDLAKKALAAQQAAALRELRREGDTVTMPLRRNGLGGPANDSPAAAWSRGLRQLSHETGKAVRLRRVSGYPGVGAGELGRAALRIREIELRLQQARADLKALRAENVTLSRDVRMLREAERRADAVREELEEERRQCAEYSKVIVKLKTNLKRMEEDEARVAEVLQKTQMQVGELSAALAEAVAGQQSVSAELEKMKAAQANARLALGAIRKAWAKNVTERHRIESIVALRYTQEHWDKVVAVQQYGGEDRPDVLKSSPVIEQVTRVQHAAQESWGSITEPVSALGSGRFAALAAWHSKQQQAVDAQRGDCYKQCMETVHTAIQSAKAARSLRHGVVAVVRGLLTGNSTPEDLKHELAADMNDAESISLSSKVEDVWKRLEALEQDCRETDRAEEALWNREAQVVHSELQPANEGDASAANHDDLKDTEDSTQRMPASSLTLFSSSSKAADLWRTLEALRAEDAELLHAWHAAYEEALVLGAIPIESLHPKGTPLNAFFSPATTDSLESVADGRRENKLSSSSAKLAAKSRNATGPADLESALQSWRSELARDAVLAEIPPTLYRALLLSMQLELEAQTRARLELESNALTTRRKLIQRTNLLRSALVQQRLLKQRVLNETRARQFAMRRLVRIERALCAFSAIELRTAALALVAAANVTLYGNALSSFLPQPTLQTTARDESKDVLDNEPNAADTRDASASSSKATGGTDAHAAASESLLEERIEIACPEDNLGDSETPKLSSAALRILGTLATTTLAAACTSGLSLQAIISQLPPSILAALVSAVSAQLGTGNFDSTLVSAGPATPLQSHRRSISLAGHAPSSSDLRHGRTRSVFGGASSSTTASSASLSPSTPLNTAKSQHKLEVSASPMVQPLSFEDAPSAYASTIVPPIIVTPPNTELSASQSPMKLTPDTFRELVAAAGVTAVTIHSGESGVSATIPLSVPLPANLPKLFFTSAQSQVAAISRGVSSMLTTETGTSDSNIDTSDCAALYTPVQLPATLGKLTEDIMSVVSWLENWQAETKEALVNEAGLFAELASEPASLMAPVSSGGPGSTGPVLSVAPTTSSAARSGSISNELVTQGGFLSPADDGMAMSSTGSSDSGSGGGLVLDPSVPRPLAQALRDLVIKHPDIFARNKLVAAASLRTGFAKQVDANADPGRGTLFFWNSRRLVLEVGTTTLPDGSSSTEALVRRGPAQRIPLIDVLRSGK